MARITGTTAADNLDGTEEEDLILVYDPANPGTDTDRNLANGNGGDDTILGSVARDRLQGQAGNDLILGEGGDDALVGFEGRDTLLGGEGDDTMDGDEGADLLVGESGDDVIFAQAGRDTLSGGEGDDELYGFEGADLLLGGAGDDELEGDAGADTLSGGAGEDTFAISVFFGNSRAAAPDLLLDFEGAGVAGGDRIRFFDDLVFRGGIALDPVPGATLGGAGNGASDLFFVTGAEESFLLADRNDDGVLGPDDLLVRFEGSLAFSLDDFVPGSVARGGTDGDDTLSGTGADEVILGLDGDDLLLGRAGSDTLYGGRGDDTLKGNSGFDSLVGGEGDDVLQLGDNGNAEGGDGNDLLIAGRERFFALNGGDGFDTASFARGAAGVEADLQTGLVDGSDFLFRIEALTGSAFGDTLRGDDFGNLLGGGAGDDLLEGRGGDDTLLGGAGTDTLVGGAGKDSLVGGGGDDLFVLVAADGPGRDVIEDFDGDGDDVLSLSGFALDSFDEVQAALSQRGADVVLNLGDGARVLFLGTTVADFAASDFVFA